MEPIDLMIKFTEYAEGNYEYNIKSLNFFSKFYDLGTLTRSIIIAI